MSTQESALVSIYERRIGGTLTRDEAYGYWIFALGFLFGIVGILLFLQSNPATSLRQWSIVLGTAGFALLVAGPIIRLPLKLRATYTTALGLVLCGAAIAWFFTIYPNDWNPTTGHTGVLVLYAVGIGVMGLGGLVVPLLSRTKADVARETAEAATREAEARASEAEAAASEAEARAAESDERAEAAEADLATARDRAADADALEAQLASLRESQAQFEVFEDSSGEFRWRLRHRNGNVIAASGEGYTRKHNAQKGLHSVRRNALGAAILHVDALPDVEPGEAALEDVEVLPEVTEDSQATVEVYEDKGGEWRWRLRHRNGKVLADSGEGYSRRQGLDRAVASLQRTVEPAGYLRFDPASFEIYRDVAGEWRWRLVHENGNILADGGQGYARRRNARRAVDRLQETAGEADFEEYEDEAGEHRWRLVASNGNIVADSGEGYTDRSELGDAVERVREYAPEADVLDMGVAGFEVYEDAGGEWRWRLRHRNGNVLADGGEGYTERSDAQEAIRRVKRHAPAAEVEERED